MMTLVLIEYLIVTLALLKSEKAEMIDEDLVAWMASATEWEQMEELVPDFQTIKDYSRESLEKELTTALTYLTNVLKTKGYENEHTARRILWVYDCQWFCQITQPLTYYPELAKKFRELYEIEAKGRLIV